MALQLWVNAVFDWRALGSGYERSFQPPRTLGYIQGLNIRAVVHDTSRGNNTNIL